MSEVLWSAVFFSVLHLHHMVYFPCSYARVHPLINKAKRHIESAFFRISKNPGSKIRFLIHVNEP